MSYKTTYKSYGEKAILIEWKSVICENILTDIITFKDKISAKKKNELEDCIVGYNSLTVKYKSPLIDVFLEIEKLKAFYKNQVIKDQTINYTWSIPVCYDEQFGIDLQEISEKLKLPQEEIVQRHFNTIYTVFFIGFLPGFLYLGGLHEKLAFDRKPIPRLLVEKGSVAIGGSQTGIYPSSNAGGWNIIGKTPVSFFDINQTSPCFAKSGDKIKFYPVTLSEYYKMKKKVANHTFIIKKTTRCLK